MLAVAVRALCISRSEGHRHLVWQCDFGVWQLRKGNGADKNSKFGTPRIGICARSVFSVGTSRADAYHQLESRELSLASLQSGPKIASRNILAESCLEELYIYAVWFSVQRFFFRDRFRPLFRSQMYVPTTRSVSSARK